MLTILTLRNKPKRLRVGTYTWVESKQVYGYLGSGHDISDIQAMITALKTILEKQAKQSQAAAKFDSNTRIEHLSHNYCIKLDPTDLEPILKDVSEWHIRSLSPFQE